MLDLMNAKNVNAVSDPKHVADPVVDSAATTPALLQADLTAQQDRYLRLAADFENFRKRARRDTERQAAARKDAFIHDLLPVLDNLERALAHGRAHPSLNTALRELGQLLQRQGIEAVDDVGRPFDPHRQEAVSMRNAPMQPDHVVLEVAQRGYCRGEEVFRPAKVVVNDLTHFPGAGDGR